MILSSAPVISPSVSPPDLSFELLCVFGASLSALIVSRISLPAGFVEEGNVGVRFKMAQNDPLVFTHLSHVFAS